MPWKTWVWLTAFVFASVTTEASFGATVGGIVRGVAQADPIPNARVTLFDAALAFFAEARTDGSGGYSFQNVPDGSYSIGACAPGREYIESAIVISVTPSQIDFDLGPETHPGEWSVVGDTAPELLDGTGSGSLLATGEALYCHDTIDPIVFDPVTEVKWFPIPSSTNQGCHVTTLLTNGDLFFVGGSMGGNPSDPIVKVSKVYTRATDTWTQLADMNIGRWYPGLIRLPHERFLVVGGELNGAPARTDTCELYDPATDAWAMTGSMDLPVEMPPAVLLNSGEVLKTWRFAELYDVPSGTWRATGDFVQARPGAPVGQHSDHIISYLPDGRVMAMGIDPVGDPGTASMVELYDAESESWSVGPTPQHLRQRPEGLLMPDGRVVMFGGEYTGNDPGSLELDNSGAVQNVTKLTDIFDPSTNSWRSVADMNRFIHYHNVSVLAADGRVIATAGAGESGIFGDDPGIEAYKPPYLFRGIRPQIDSISATDLEPGSQLTMQVSFTSSVTRVVLLGTRTVSHWIDCGVQRYLSLDFTQNGSQVTATVPCDRVQALAGYYTLFVLVDDIPSIGQVVRVLDVDSTELGDVDGDGEFDIADVPPFVSVLLGNSLDCDEIGRADVNGDGITNGRDIQPFMDALTSAPPPPSDTVTDDFERHNLGSDWLVIAGTIGILNDSDMAAFSTGLNIAGWQATAFSADQFCEAELSADWDPGDNVQVAVRLNLATNARYGFLRDASNGELQVKLDGLNPGVVLASTSAVNVQPGDTLRIEVQGTTIRGLVNGVPVLTATDTTLANGTAGVAFVPGATTPAPYFESWSGGSL